MKKLLPLLISAGLLFAGVASALVTLPPSIQKGDLLVATSTTQLVRLPTSTLGSVLTMFGNIPTWKATSTLGFTGGGTPCTLVAGSIQYNNGGFFGCVPAGSAGTALFASSTSASGYEWKGVSGAGTVTSVDMTVPTGLNVSGNPITAAGTLAIDLQAGYNIPLTASTTNWNDFWNTPSTRITAGSYLSWSGNTLNSSSTPYFTGLNVSSNTLLGGTLGVTGIANFNGWTNNGNGTTTTLRVNTSAYIPALSNLTTDGFVKTSGGNGTLGIDTNTYLTGNQTITLSGDISGSGATSIITSYNGIVPINKGGTGTSTAPTLGQLLMGNASGGYNLVATSSLGITGGGAYNIISANGLISVSTTTALATLTASTSPTFTYVGTTNASTTNLTIATNSYLGTVLQGTWNGGIIGTAYGGTATSTAPSDNALFVGNGTNFYQSVLPSCSDPTNSKLLYNNTTRAFSCGTDQSGGGGSLSGGTRGYVATWASSTSLTIGTLIDNGTVSGVNATSSSYTFNIQGTSNVSPFNVASSTGVSLFSIDRRGAVTITGEGAGQLSIGSSTPYASLTVVGTSSFPTLDLLNIASSSGVSVIRIASNGSTTLPSLGTGAVYASNGSLYTGAAGGGIASLNGLTGASQTFATSTSGGIDLFINSATTIHTFTLAPSSGYAIPLTASTTAWNKLYLPTRFGNVASTTISAYSNKSYGTASTTFEIAGFSIGTTMVRMVCQTRAGTVNISWGSSGATSNFQADTNGATSTPSITFTADQMQYLTASSSTAGADGLTCQAQSLPN